MKKTLIALAVAGVAVSTAPVAMADAGAYVSIRTSIAMIDDGSDASQLRLTDEASRFGFKGTEDLGNGMSAFGRYEFSVSSNQTNINGTNRLSFVGLKGGFGSVSIGRQWSPFYEHVAGANDTFGGLDNVIQGGLSSAPDGAGADTGGVSIRTGNSLKYENMMGGMKLGAMLVMQQTAATDEDEIDRIDISLSGKAGAISWGAGFVKDSDSLGDATTAGAQVGFMVNKNLTLRGVFVSADKDATVNAAGDAVAETGLSLLVDFGLGGGSAVQARFSSRTDEDSMFAAGYTKKLSKSTKYWAEFALTSFDDKGTNGNTGGATTADDVTEINVGIRHDF